jgi:diguanylate cyclase (GGDEF)-like protein
VDSGVSELKPDRPAADATRDMSREPAAVRSTDERGRPLLVEVAIPIALGLLVVVAALGLVALGASRIDGGFRYAAAPVAVGLVAGLGLWVAWVLRDTALVPLAALRAGIRGLEVGDFTTQVDPQGAREFRDLAHSFNRSVRFLDHQRARLKTLATTDPLTGLANDRALYERLRSEVERIGDGGGALAVIAVDLDGFKQINEQFSHSRGDEVLTLVGTALAGAVREGDLVARHSGDTFVLVIRDVDPAHARSLADRARDAVRRAVGHELPLDCSAGYVCAPSQAGPEADLVELASTALRVAKRQGGARTQKYDPHLARTLPTARAQRQEIEAILRSREPIEPVFQPIVELRTGRLVGYEALARFAGYDNRGPDALFNQAARCGLGPQLEAVALAAALRAPGRPPGTYLSLNCTPTAISSSLVRASLPADLSDVVIEITEHELAPEDGALEAGLAELRARGARIAIDDAGAGYAGLQQVMRVQPDIIKLDRGIVANVDTDSARAALIEFFTVFARRIGAQVCCEGIETPAELDALASLGVTLGQGYLLGRPAAPWAPIAPAAVSAIGARQRAARAAEHRADPPVTAIGPVNRRLGRAARR